MVERSRWSSAELADELIGRIARGDLRPGQRLPSARQLAQERNVAPGTAHAALRVLNQRGLVVTRVGSGTFVTNDRQAIAAAGGAADLTTGDVSTSIDDTLSELHERIAALEGQLGQIQETVNALDTDPAPPGPDLGPGD